MRKYMYKHDTNSTMNGAKKVSCENIKSCYFIYKGTERRGKTIRKKYNIPRRVL
jgi:hypothetical protein